MLEGFWGQPLVRITGDPEQLCELYWEPQVGLHFGMKNLEETAALTITFKVLSNE